MTTRGLIDEPASSFRSRIDHHGEQMCDFRHFGPLGPARWEGVKMVRSPYLLTIMVDLTSETCRTIVSYHADKNEASFRNGIDHHDDQMCDYHHFGVLDAPSGRGVQMVIMPYLLTIMVD